MPDRNGGCGRQTSLLWQRCLAAEAEVVRLSARLNLIADIAAGSRTVNSFQHIEKIARGDKSAANPQHAAVAMLHAHAQWNGDVFTTTNVVKRIFEIVASGGKQS